MTLVEKTFQAGEITLSYDEGNGDGPPMVLLHGLTGMTQRWRATLIPAYGDSWHQYAIDLRGHGKSGHASDERNYRIIDYAEDIIAFIKSEIDEPPVIVGHSLGAMTAIAVGTALGDGARGLILIDPPLPVRELTVDAFTDAFGWFSWIYNTLKNNPSYEQVIDACREINPGANEQQINGMSTQVSSLAIGTVGTALDNRIAEDFDFGIALDNITCPILLLYAEFGQSGSTREVDAEFVAEHARHFSKVRFPYDDHMFFETHWDETHPHISAFLEAL